jgi:hypothetical protein
MDTALNSTFPDSATAQEPGIIDKITDWAIENPIAALLTVAAIAATGYSAFRNTTKTSTGSYRRKRRKLIQEEASIQTGSLSPAAEIKSFLQNDPEKKDSGINIPNTIAAVTTAVATTAVGATKEIPLAVTSISGVAIGAIGLLTHSPIAMIAGVGLLAGSVLKTMLSKTVKPVSGLPVSEIKPESFNDGVVEAKPDAVGSAQLGNNAELFDSNNIDFPFPQNADLFWDWPDQPLSSPSQKRIKLEDQDDYDFDKM